MLKVKGNNNQTLMSSFFWIKLIRMAEVNAYAQSPSGIEYIIKFGIFIRSGAQKILSEFAKSVKLM